jgi:hypothetical protein
MKKFNEIDSASMVCISNETGIPLKCVELLYGMSMPIYIGVLNNNDYENCYYNFNGLSRDSYENYLGVCELLGIAPLLKNGNWDFGNKFKLC